MQSKMRAFGNPAALIACAGMVLSGSALAAEPAATAGRLPAAQSSQPAVAVTDVTLGPAGVLMGQVLHGAGQPAEGMLVVLRQNGRQVATTHTDDQGNFTIGSLRGGVHELAAGDSIGCYRFWSAGSAPPAAKQSVLVVADSTLVRGQGSTRGPVMRFFTNPWVVAGMVATAIAVPIAIVSSNSSSS